MIVGRKEDMEEVGGSRRKWATSVNGMVGSG